MGRQLRQAFLLKGEIQMLLYVCENSHFFWGGASCGSCTSSNKQTNKPKMGYTQNIVLDGSNMEGSRGTAVSLNYLMSGQKGFSWRWKTHTTIHVLLGDSSFIVSYPLLHQRMLVNPLRGFYLLSGKRSEEPGWAFYFFSRVSSIEALHNTGGFIRRL